MNHLHYIWTACSAGWAGLWVVGAGDMCALVSIGCGCMAYLFYRIEW